MTPPGPRTIDPSRAGGDQPADRRELDEMDAADRPAAWEASAGSSSRTATGRWIHESSYFRRIALDGPSRPARALEEWAS